VKSHQDVVGAGEELCPDEQGERVRGRERKFDLKGASEKFATIGEKRCGGGKRIKRTLLTFL
jgi:hypothetical protein